MMRTQEPDLLNTRQRVALGLIGLLVFQFALVAAANGVLYLPGKNGGILLSGIPTALVVLSCLALSTALMLRLFSHHGRQWLARHQPRVISVLAWSSAGLFVMALVMALMMAVLPISASPAIPWRLDWFDLTPQTVAGWMVHVPQEFKPSTGSFLVGFGFLMLAALWTLLHPAPHTSRVTGLLCGVSLVLLGSAWLLHLLFQIASGQFKPLFSALPVTWSVEAPAHFQAVVATLLTLALLTLLMGALMLILACIPSRDRDRSSPPNPRRTSQRPHRGRRRSARRHRSPAR